MKDTGLEGNAMNLSFQLRPRPPFRLDLTAWALRRNPANIVDRWDGETYRRVLMLDSKPVEVEVTQEGTLEKPRLLVTATGTGSQPRLKVGITEALKRMLGLRIDLTSFYRFAENDQELSRLSRRFLGLKPPRFPDLFEALVNAFACQQLSLTVCILLLNRLALHYGVPFYKKESTLYAFPQPEAIAGAEAGALRKLGFSRQKIRFMTELAQRVVHKRLNLEGLELLDDEAALKELGLILGVGRWTAEYILLRGMGRMDSFPSNDSGARGKLWYLLKRRKPLDYEGIHRVLGRWKPYRGLIYFYMLLDGLSEEGYLQETMSRS